MQSTQEIQNSSRGNSIYPFVIIALYGITYSFIFSLNEISFDFSIILGATLSLITYSVWLLLRLTQKFYHSPVVFTSANTLKLLIFTAIGVGAYYFILSFLSRWQRHITEVLNQEVWLISITSLLILALLLTSHWIQQQKIREEKIRNYVIEKEREVQQVALNSIREQFKPHFLFNSLNSIGALCLTRPEEAREMILLLSDFMRKNVNYNTKELVSLKDEIDFIQKYISIEKIRFGARLNVKIDINESDYEATVPTLILQPIIENAIKYGVYGTLDDVVINIKANKTKDLVSIEICNPFDSEASSRQKGTGFGLQSVEKRLQLIYNRGQLLSVEKKDELFCTKLLIPQL